MPLISLSSFCKGTYVLPRRNDVFRFVKNHDVYPHLYDGFNLRASDVGELIYHKLHRPNLVQGLRPLPQGLRYIQEWLEVNRIRSPIVTITLRCSPFDTARNSDIEAWSMFTGYLLESGYHPVIIPDTDNAFGIDSSFEGATIFRDCAWNIGLRAALYESAFLNFFVPNGPSSLAVCNANCSYIFMNMLPAGSIVSTEEAYQIHGFKIGDSYKFATAQQRLCWKPDTFDNIKSEFDRFVNETLV